MYCTGIGEFSVIKRDQVEVYCSSKTWSKRDLCASSTIGRHILKIYIPAASISAEMLQQRHCVLRCFTFWNSRTSLPGPHSWCWTFIHRRYSPGWTLASLITFLHSCRSRALVLHPLTLIVLRSCPTSSQCLLGRPFIFVLCILSFSILFGIRFSSIS
jgi:hypothetical protein